MYIDSVLLRAYAKLVESSAAFALARSEYESILSAMDGATGSELDALSLKLQVAAEECAGRGTYAASMAYVYFRMVEGHADAATDVAYPDCV